MSPVKMPLKNVRAALRPAEVFICSASFESRCMALPLRLVDVPFQHVLVCANVNFPKVLQKETKQLLNAFDSRAQLVRLNTTDPIFTADNLRLAIETVREARILIDITTFTHESLLILLRILKLLSIPSVDLLYTTADDYSVGDSDDRKWLSKGIGEIGSVLGYPGHALPSRKLHLIIMTGFEAERAERLIQEYEPSQISLGLGDKDDSIRPEHYRANELFHARLVEKYTNVLQFAFSLSDSVKARDALRLQATKVSGHNTLIAPMNTKISTVGAALFGMEDNTIQLCYATAHQYNEKGYSSPGQECYYFSVRL